jgi:hypothetical protein
MNNNESLGVFFIVPVSLGGVIAILILSTDTLVKNNSTVVDNVEVIFNCKYRLFDS